ncbi:MAG: secretin N-terminal domain-containing protein [Candidatus Omnitrophica bacterium]|nr:secretin N-terminal domain-containing protein [Candidatus Omnitrophota bacterium]MDD5042554.1 secretin N-terminal domain-containing protein [Candidatus Omnitrophota bacterium]MDD5501068.1 secretin N-terminal domain-containing protein [Candidatus Omnitrophota bacterium]
MKRLIFLIAVLLMVLFGMMPIMAQDAVEEKPQAADQAETVAPAAKEEAKDAKNEAAKEEVVEDASDPFSGLSRRISLDLRSMDIMDTVKFLSKQGNLNIVATKNVNGKVTLFLKDVTISDVLDMILLTNSLACEKKAGIITLMTENEYEALYGEKYTNKKETKTISLKYADPKRVGTILGNLKSSVGKVIIDDATGMIILIDTPEKIKEMEEAASRADISTVNRVIPTIRETFELEYAKIGEVKGEISKVLTKDVGSIEVDERTNKIVVTDLPHNMERIRQLIADFDSKTREVLIEAKIVEITLSDNYAMGVDWQKVYGLAEDSLTLTGTFPFSAPTATSSTMKLSIGTLADNKYEFALTLIKSFGKLKVVSSPHIVVCNNEEAKFMVGTREAYVTTTITTGDVTTTTSESVQFIDVGVTLYVTPTINKGGFVKMHIKPEVSSISEWLETTEGNKIPIVDTSNVETDVLVKDGNTIILAGLIKTTTDKNVAKMPLLGSLPVLGKLFSNVSDTNSKKELAIFLTPHVITGGEAMLQLKENIKTRKPPKR